MMAMSFLVRPFERRDQDAARQSILAGLGEHFGWIDETRNTDLDDITDNYVERGYTFVIAETDGELVGTGALITEGENTGRIVRMSVNPMYRRKGIGRALVMHPLNVARRKGLTQVWVSTKRGWEDAIGLYRHCAFTEYRRDETAIYFSIALMDG
jgi:GNAT superfamily N-acetyltransferase